MAYTKYSLTPANNNAAPPDGAPEGMLPSAVNDTMRDMMAQIRDCGDGIRGGTYTMTAPVITGGSISGSTMSSNVITGGSINNTPIGASTANTGAFTTLSATGVTIVQAGSASAPAIVPSGDPNTGIFFPAADTIAFAEGGAEAMRIDSSGNVGIGVSSIAQALDIYKNGAAIVQIRGGTGSNQGGGFYVRNAANTSSFCGFGDSANQVGGTPEVLAAIYSATGIPFAFNVSGQERMRIDTFGNVGIGTNSPGSKLEISSSNPFFTIYNTNTGDNGITWESDAASGASRASIFVNYSNAELRTTAGVSGNSYIQSFYTNGSERMRISSSGNLLVGTTSETYAANGIRFNPVQDGGNINIGHPAGSTNGMVYMGFGLNGTAIGNIQQVGTTGVAFVTTSDYRLKENIAPMTGALGTVSKLKPVTYNWKVDGSAGQGFIAHELQAVVPDCVTGEKDATRIEKYEIFPAIQATFDEEGNELTSSVDAVMGEREVPNYQGIDTSFLVATLTAAIQELNAKVTALEEQVINLSVK
jgi:hypothetical protein